MRWLIRLLILCWALLIGSGCADTSALKSSVTERDAPDPDAADLAALSQQAILAAQTESSDVVLRQVSTDLNNITFLFTDAAATKAIYVHVPGLGVSTDQWQVQVETVSHYSNRPGRGLDLKQLVIGPQRVAQAIQAHWQGCALNFMVLYEEGGTLIWRAFCETLQGMVAGNLDQETQIFQPDKAYPAPLPATDTP